MEKLSQQSICFDGITDMTPYKVFYSMYCHAYAQGKVIRQFIARFSLNTISKQTAVQSPSNCHSLYKVRYVAAVAHVEQNIFILTSCKATSNYLCATKYYGIILYTGMIYKSTCICRSVAPTMSWIVDLDILNERSVNDNAIGKNSD